VRQRGTAVVIRDGKVLLVRDRGKHRFSLPGGAVNKNEPTVSAAAREVYEELGLHINMVKRLRECDFKGSLSEHKVCLVEADGEPHLKGHELDKFIWWDTEEPIPVYEHVNAILKKIKGVKTWEPKAERT
jgi:8-oxo-dGTP pyrophosphatase MutT (NUDIX family)